MSQRVAVVPRTAELVEPREWVLERIEHVAEQALDLSDSWEYRRLLELAVLRDSAPLRRLVLLGLGSAAPNVREAAEDFRTNPT